MLILVLTKKNLKLYYVLYYLNYFVRHIYLVIHLLVKIYNYINKFCNSSHPTIWYLVVAILGLVALCHYLGLITMLLRFYFSTLVQSCQSIEWFSFWLHLWMLFCTNCWF